MCPNLIIITQEVRITLGDVSYINFNNEIVMSDIGLLAPVGRIILKEIEKEETSKGGIILSAATSDPENKARIGEIVSNGILVNGKENELFKVGNKVYFGKYSGATIDLDGDKFVSIVESEVAAIAK